LEHNTQRKKKGEGGTKNIKHRGRSKVRVELGILHTHRGRSRVRVKLGT
jgi:hypothetical protein